MDSYTYDYKDRWTYNYYKSKKLQQAERDFTEFWLWACSEGYDIYRKDLKIAWDKYVNSEFGISRGVKDRYYYKDDNLARETLNEYIIATVGDSRKR